MLSLCEGFERSELTAEQAWIEYLTMGGQCSRSKVKLALRGEVNMGAIEHNKLAAALNDSLVDAGEDHPVGYDESAGSRVFGPTEP